MSEQVYRIEIALISNVSFIGNENGTVIDYNYGRRGSFVVSYSRNKWDKITFKNIIFEHYSTNGVDYPGIQIISVSSNANNIQTYLENCTFRDNQYRLLSFQLTSYEIISDKPQVVLNNCVFENNSQRLISISHKYDYALDEAKKYFKLKFINCKYINNKGLFCLKLPASVEFDNCYFSTIEKDSYDSNSVLFFTSLLSSGHLSIKNSIFEDIDVKSKLPIINGEGLTLE
ncbi:hypothetical protein PIROE2DRAFT_1795 [Piromyces sp. E2]|nr:hypothetical protein PIROE2DRAFT_1795 [Piromyces sp. E2]|eukprot:OUM70114.1 hypothetical protein PIROE2DRAFT_1795 [Piromyces sp. E2]